MQKDTELFIKQAKETHTENKDSYEKVKYKNNAEKIIITCHIHGDYKQVPVEHLSGKRCRQCADDMMRKGKEKFVAEMNIKWNFKYDYSKFNYQSNDIKGIIICPLHNEFEQTPNSHMYYGCYQCGRDIIKLSEEEYKFRCSLQHNNFYNYERVKYFGAFKEVEIGCPKHGYFWQRASHHLEGIGCRDCQYEARIIAYTEFKTRGKEKHNNRYSYNDPNYIDASHKTWIDCNKHGSFHQLGHSHLQGCGCPKCSDNISKPEIAWLDSLNIPEEYRQTRFNINGKTIIPDAYDPKTNTCFLFHGTFWHGHPDHFAPEKINPINKKSYGELYANTIKQEELLIKAGYNLIVMWEHNFQENQ